MIKEFLRHEASGGILLGMAALLALILSNTGLEGFYQALLEVPFAISIGNWGLEKPIILWINDGLMAVFFLLVGLEIKREVLQGELSRPEQISLPVIAAIGGMAAPALVYVTINFTSPETLHGWAIPAATDIAFALGVISLLGKRVPEAIKIALVAIAIIDDLGAIIIIALFYTEQLSLLSLGFAGVALLGLIALNLFGVRKIAPYILLGVVMWVCVLKSGVHATLAGVFTAFCIPLKTEDEEHSPLIQLEHSLHPWVTYMILPIFAFANAGVSLLGISADILWNPVTLGIFLGLVVGKQCGVFGLTWYAAKRGWCALPSGVNWQQFYGLSLLCGIGFTMSLFIGTLAFADPDQLVAVRLGVLSGSILCGIIGYVVLWRTSSPADTDYPSNSIT